jgi:hypothetical protein
MIVLRKGIVIGIILRQMMAVGDAAEGSWEDSLLMSSNEYFRDSA